MRLCRRAPGSSLNLKLDAPVGQKNPAQDKKTYPNIPSSALLSPLLPFPAPQHWLVLWMARPGWVNQHSSSPVCSMVPFWVAGKTIGQIWKHKNELRTSWELSENDWGQHSPSLSWAVPVPKLLPLGRCCLQAHWGIRVSPALWCLPTSSPPLWATELREVLREMFRVGRSCLSPLEARPNAVNSSCCSPTERTISVSAPPTFICGRAQNSSKILSQSKAFLVTLGCSKSEWLLDWYGFLRRHSESDCDK